MKKNVDVKILDARLHDNPPAYATPGSAGIDLRACIDESIIIQPGRAGSPFISPTRIAPR